MSEARPDAISGDGVYGQSGLKRKADDTAIADERPQKHQRTAPTALHKQSQWIKPAFSTPNMRTPNLGRSTPMASTVPKFKPNPSVSTPVRPLSAVSRPLSRLREPTPVSLDSTPARVSKPLGFSLPPTMLKDETRPSSRPHTPLSSMLPIPLSSNKGKRPMIPFLSADPNRSLRTPLTTKLALVSTPRSENEGSRSGRLGIADHSDDKPHDEIDRGLGLSPEKIGYGKGKGLVRNGLAERASHLITRSATDNTLWQQSISASSTTPDLKLSVISVLSKLAGRTLTRCRITDEEIVPGEVGDMEGTVLFSGGMRDVKAGMIVGIWRPWGELNVSTGLEAHFSAPNTTGAQASSGPAASLHSSAIDPQPATLSSTGPGVDTTAVREPSSGCRAGPSRLEASSSRPFIAPHVLLVTRYFILP